MNGLDEVWAYDEPHESGGNCHITMTKQQAIDWIRNVYKHRPKYRFATDQTLFNEFVVIHWAYKENEEESK